jgi:6-phosphogluconolactonase
MTEPEDIVEPAPEAADDGDRQPPTLTAPTHIFVGGYTAEMGGTANGVRLYRPDPSAADDAEIGFTDQSSAELSSPSFLIKHPKNPWLYALSESSPGKVSALRYDSAGLHLINSQDSGGDGGCHLCFDHSGKFVIVAHYSSGSIASFRIGDSGELSERISLLEFSGSGPDPDRQDASHAHQVVSVGASILVPDLGTDSVHIVRIDEDGELTPATDSISLPPGSGPRHLVLAGRHLVVACELTASLWVGALDAEVGAEGTSLPTSTRETEQRIYPSAIAQFGDQIVVANRGADTVSVFTLDAFGTPHPLVEVDCGGSWPRDLTVDDDQLWIANQQSNSVTVIKPAAVSNKPEDWQQVLHLDSPSPACVVVAR